MKHGIPSHLALLAGRGVYPRLLAEAARRAGVERLSIVGFKGETDRALARWADEMQWIYVGQLQALLDAVRAWGVRDAVMAGQIAPSNLFHVRLDRPMRALLAALKIRNAETIFSAVGDALHGVGVSLRPACLFMESAMPAPGAIARRAPTPREQDDIALGWRVAKASSALDVGQTVVVKEGTVLAVEAFEGTNDAIRRACRLGGAGAVVVKVAKPDHDMRFDIPVIGLHTLEVLRKGKVAALAVEAGRTILLEREKLAAEADRIGLCFMAVAEDAAGEPAAEKGNA